MLYSAGRQCAVRTGRAQTVLTEPITQPRWRKAIPTDWRRFSSRAKASCCSPLEGGQFYPSACRVRVSGLRLRRAMVTGAGSNAPPSCCSGHAAQ